MRNCLLILLVSWLTISCANLPSKEDDGEWYQNMIDIIKNYEWVYLELPKEADDIIHYMELDEGFLSEGLYESQYDFLKKNRKRILFIPDNGLTYLYLRNNKNPIVYISESSYCEYEQGLNGSRRFFNDSKDPILGKSYETLNADFKNRLKFISYKYPTIEWQKEDGELFEDIIILEYSKSNGLINKCTNTKIDLQEHTYYQNLNDCLKNFAEEKRLDKIILDSYIPK